MRFWQTLLLASSPSGDSLLDGDAIAWAAAVVANGGSVSAGRKTLVSTLISASKACGHWYLTDDIALLVGENATQALTTLKRRALMTVTAAPTFTTDRGYAFNGTSQFIDTGWVASTMAVAMNVGNVRLGIYERTNVSTNTTAMGGSGNAGAQNFIIRPRISTSFALSQMQIATATSTDSVTDGRGLTVSSRAGNATTTLFYKNGVAFAPITGLVGPATVLSGFSLYIGANNNAGAAASFRASTIGCAEWGAPMSSTAVELAWYTALQAFMTAVGANV